MLATLDVYISPMGHGGCPVFELALHCMPGSIRSNEADMIRQAQVKYTDGLEHLRSTKLSQSA